MSVQPILEEMLGLIQAQVQAVTDGDYEAVVAGATRHEEMLAALREATGDDSPEKLQPLLEQLQREKTKLQSLLTTEMTRVDFLLRLILGGEAPEAGGYSNLGPRPEGASRILDRRA